MSDLKQKKLGDWVMYDLSKIVQGKSLTETEENVIKYILSNMDTVLEKGVRQIARENFTSPASIMRLSKKLGYSGFIDMYYQLLPLVQESEKESITDESLAGYNPLEEILKVNDERDMKSFIALLKSSKSKYVFIYATGFSAIIGEYFYKKFLVCGQRVIFATGTDSIAILESNIDSIGMLLTVTKSGETQQVIEKMNYCKERGIPVVTFTNEMDNRAAELADVTLRVTDAEKLDDRNMSPNFFFSEILMLFEYLMRNYCEGLR